MNNEKSTTLAQTVEDTNLKKVFSITNGDNIYIVTFANIGRYTVSASKCAVIPPVWKLFSIKNEKKNFNMEFNHNNHGKLSMVRISNLAEKMATRIIIFSNFCAHNSEKTVDYVEVGAPYTKEHFVFNFNKLINKFISADGKEYSGNLANLDVSDILLAESKIRKAVAL